MQNSYKKLRCKNTYLAYKQLLFKSNTNVLFLGGYGSNMEGRKAVYIENMCKELKVSVTRFDYSGHGMSPGQLEEFTIGDWLNDSVEIFDRVVKGETVLVASSMGGWLAFLLCLRRAKLIKAIICIAPAIDFTENLIWRNLDDSQKENVKKQGFISICLEKDYEHKFSHKLVSGGKDYLILDKEIKIECPVYLLHGEKDSVVPYSISLEVMNKLISKKVDVRILKGAGHRMSEPYELKILGETLKQALENL